MGCEPLDEDGAVDSTVGQPSDVCRFDVHLDSSLPIIHLIVRFVFS